MDDGMEITRHNWDIYDNVWTYEIIIENNKMKKFKVADSNTINLRGYEDRYQHISSKGMTHFNKNFMYKYNITSSYMVGNEERHQVAMDNIFNVINEPFYGQRLPYK